MGMGYTRSIGANSIPVWQGTDDDIQLSQGGYLLVATGLALKTVIPAGTPIVFDEATRQATILDVAILFSNAGATDVIYFVNKGHTLKFGDNFSTGAVGGKAYPITAIDSTTYTDRDAVTVGTTIGAATAGDTMYASTATGPTASALPAINGCLYADTLVEVGQDLSVVIRGTAYARRVPYSAAIAAALKANGAYITYSQSK
jgi:hypothetical protein